MSGQNKKSLGVREVALFAMLGALMFVSKLLMEALPNVHLLGVLTVVYTVVFRKKALIPLYLYVFANGIYAGFNVWWLPYLYLWTLLWGAVMLLPKEMPPKIAPFVYSLVCGLHGLCFGTLYAPAYALSMKMTFPQMIDWIILGLPWDLWHALSNFVLGLFILPLARVLSRMTR